MITFNPKNVETEPLDREILVHGAMNYKCQDCGRTFRMWLEKGLEDKMQDEVDSDKHKPVPFTIGCLCGGMAEHMAWHQDIKLEGYRPLANNMSYFENSEDSDCGISHLRTDGNTNTLIASEEIRILASQMQKEEDKRIEQIKNFASPSGLEHYSTTQLKAELRRRKKER